MQEHFDHLADLFNEHVDEIEKKAPRKRKPKPREARLTILDVMNEAIDAPGEKPKTITVISSDTWGRLALRAGVDAKDLAAANGMTCRSLLTAGTRLRLP